MKRRINKKNVLRMIILLVCIGLVAHDLYMITLSQFFTGHLASWTIYGFVTFIFATMLGTKLAEDLKLF